MTATVVSPGPTLKIYLLLLDHARFFFYSDDSEKSAGGDDPTTPVPSGISGWFHARYNRFRVAWQHADSGALFWMRRSWDWLHTWVHPDEAMLARLWSARAIDLHYPAARTVDVVRAIWSDYLKSQWWRHVVWLLVNGFIAPFSLLLFVLPGPNLIGYWFAYRAVHHALVVWGIRRVLQNKIPVTMLPIAALDLPVERNDDGLCRHAALSGQASRLDDHVAWHDKSTGGLIGSKHDSAPAPNHPLLDVLDGPELIESKPTVAPAPGEPEPAHSPAEPS